MKVFEFDDYKVFIQKKVASLPNRGRGQYRKIAQALDIHTTMVTHIFKGDSHLSVEHALKLTAYFALNEFETEYFVTLVSLARAGNQQSKKYFENQLKKLKEKSQNLKDRLQIKKVLDKSDQATFYSNWYFSGIRLLVATDVYTSSQQIAEKMNLPLALVESALEFLISTGLVKYEINRYEFGETKTYVGQDSLLVGRHHLNWRTKIMNQFDKVPQDELSFTNPITVSKKDFAKIREEVIKFIETFRAIADPSNPEQLSILCIDWRKINF